MSVNQASPAGEAAPLSGGFLWMAAVILALANFVAILDLTIANVSVPHIASGLGVTTSEGTWVITSYAVAEAITVPLTGWLAARFGAVRVFATSMALFGGFSMLCGLAGSLNLLLAARIGQGLAGGPLIPLSQTLLLRIFPKDKAGAATGLWAMTTLVAPVLGPILGGYLCDQFSWPWIFLINVPLTAACSVAAWKVLKRYELPLLKNPVDKVGFALLVIWVGALQLMLDEGKKLGWFSSLEITGLAFTAVVGFAAFLIWELHEAHPVVDLRIFRHRGYTLSVLTLSLAFSAIFGANVLTPLWLQSFMDYTATSAGMVMAWSGLVAVFVAPLAAGLSQKIDGRKLVFGGVLWIGLVMFWRSIGNTDMDYWYISVPVMLMGLGLPFFFIPLTNLALGSVDEQETASAAGLMSFLRTVSGAFAVSLVTTSWDDLITRDHAELAGPADREGNLLSTLETSGLSHTAAVETFDRLLSGQAAMLATNHVLAWLSLTLVVASLLIWFVPKAKRATVASAAH